MRLTGARRIRPTRIGSIRCDVTAPGIGIAIAHWKRMLRRDRAMIADRPTLRALVDSEALTALSVRICARTGSTLFPSHPEPAFDSPVRRVDAAGFDVDELRAALSAERKPFPRFVLVAMGSTGLEKLDEEYPPGYGPSQDDRSAFIRSRGLSKDLLLCHLADYLVLTRRSEHLKADLEQLRTPRASKQANKLKATLEHRRGPKG
jgi:hypothetical protein